MIIISYKLSHEFHHLLTWKRLEIRLEITNFESANVDEIMVQLCDHTMVLE